MIYCIMYNCFRSFTNCTRIWLSVFVNNFILKVKAMPKHERREILRMLKLVQKAQKEINKESLDGERTMVLGKDIN